MNAREPVRVLLVSENEQTQKDVTDALARSSIEHRFFWVAEPSLASTRIQDTLPHVVLVDDGHGASDMTRSVRKLATLAPGSAILALVSEQAISEARQAVLAGARGFITKPISSEDLTVSLRQVLGQPERSATDPHSTEGAQAGRILAFCAPKGGTGRTTLAVNTAIGLGRLTERGVVLVDADYASPALDVVLNLHGERDITELFARLTRLDEELVASVLARHASGLRVLLAPPPVSTSKGYSLPQVQQVMAYLKRMFSWVVVDLGLPLDETAFAFLDGADRVVMSVLPEMVGLRNTRLMLDELTGRGYPPEKISLVLNRASIRGGVSRKDIEQRLHVKVFHQIPDDQPLVSYSVNRGVPLILSHKRSAVARSMAGFAQALVEQMAPEQATSGRQPAPQTRQSWLSKLHLVRA